MGYYRNRSRHRFTMMMFIMPIAIIIGLICVSYAPQMAQSRLTSSGYTDINLTGSRLFNAWCGRYGFPEGFTAKDSGGVERTGYVCTSPIYSFIVVD